MLGLRVRRIDAVRRPRPDLPPPAPSSEIHRGLRSRCQREIGRKAQGRIEIAVEVMTVESIKPRGELDACGVLEVNPEKIEDLLQSPSVSRGALVLL